MSTLLKIDHRHTPPVFITFSGLDGSGKSTQIENLCWWIQNAGLRVRTLAFWDDVVVGKRYRESFVHKVYGSERGVGAPGNPVKRRDKNVRAWYLSLARPLLYLLDSINLFAVVVREKLEPVDVIIMDRYIYDELANLSLRNPLNRLFVRMVVELSPKPELAYLLDADVEAACARKPEYPVEFMHACRDSYFRLADLLNITAIPPLPLDAAKEAVIEAFVNCAILHVPEADKTSGKHEFDAAA